MELFVRLFDASWGLLGSVMLFLAVLAVVTKIAGFPLSSWANEGLSENNSKFLSIGPKLTLLRSQYRGEEQAEKILELYRQARYNPYLALKPSLVLLVQIPIFIWVFIGVSGSEKARGSQLWMIGDLTQPDGLIPLGSSNVNFLPLLMVLVSAANLLHVAHLKHMGRAQFISGWAITLGFFVVLYASPSALVLYWIANITLQWLVDIVIYWREVKVRKNT